MLTDKGFVFEVPGFHEFTHATAKKSVSYSKTSNYKSLCPLPSWQIEELHKSKVNLSFIYNDFQRPNFFARLHHSETTTPPFTPDLHEESDQSVVQVKQENTQTVF